MTEISDGPVLFYIMNGTIYPVALTHEQQQMFEMTVRLLSPITIVQDRPLGTAITLKGGSKHV